METIASILEAEKIDKLLASLQKRREDFERHLDSLPQSRPCRTHTTATETLCREASFQAAEARYTCPECENESRAQRRARRIERAGIPADVRHATLENFDINRQAVAKGFHTPEKFLTESRRFQANEIRNLFLAGTTGIGKGHLAAALCIEAIDSGSTCAWVQCAELFTKYHKSYATNTNDEVVQFYGSTTLLVLDEICLRDLPADGEEVLFAVIDKRHKFGLKTILLGNKSAEETRKWLGGRISDRLRSGKVAFCYGEWESMRGTERDGAGEF